MSDSYGGLTPAGLRRGARAILPLAPGALLFGLSYGLLAAGAGLTLAEAMVMSLTVFAGASQYLAVELWRAPLPVAAIVLAALVVNLRHLLMGATLAPWLRRFPRPRVLASLFLLVDENWGLTVAALRNGERDLGFFLGAGLVLYPLWPLGGLIGYLAAGRVPDPTRYGLDSLGTAVFLVLLMLQWEGARSLLPWTVAAAVALLAQVVAPGAWPILLGALAGALAGALRPEMSRPEAGR